MDPTHPSCSESWVSQPNVCRCCVSSHGTWDINSTYITETGEKEVYADMLQECYGITLSSILQWAPRMVCTLCVEHLRGAINFRKQVLAADQQFLMYCNTKLHKTNDSAIDTDTTNSQTQVRVLKKIRTKLVSKVKKKPPPVAVDPQVESESDTPMAEPSRKNQGPHSIGHEMDGKLVNEVQIPNNETIDIVTNIDTMNSHTRVQARVLKKKRTKSVTKIKKCPPLVSVNAQLESDTDTSTLGLSGKNQELDSIGKEISAEPVGEFKERVPQKRAKMITKAMKKFSSTEVASDSSTSAILKNISPKNVVQEVLMMEGPMTVIQRKDCVAESENIGRENEPVDEFSTTQDLVVGKKRGAVPVPQGKKSKLKPAPKTRESSLSRDTHGDCKSSTSSDDNELDVLQPTSMPLVRAPEGTDLENGVISKSFIFTRLQNEKQVSERKRVILTCDIILKETNACPFRHHKSWFQCFFCQQDFMELNPLRTHTVTTHSNIDEELKKIKRYPRSLQIEISNLECRHCTLKLTDVNSMRRHFVDVHKKVIYKECIADYKVNKSPYSCHLCEKQFHVFRSLTTHLNEHYANCICDVCGKSFLNSKRLKVHKRTHENGQFPCNECGKILKTKTSKVNHIESVHSKRKIKCQICFEPMKHYNDRIKHMSEVHNITHTFKCHICSREYNIKHYLATHIRQTHGHKNKYCLECGMAFVTNHGLKKHMLKHTGVKPYTCSVCCKSYARSYTLKEHMRAHDNEIFLAPE